MMINGCISDNLGNRQYMEDRYSYAKLDLGKSGPAYFFGVYDGHGGQMSATVLANVLHLLIQKSLQNVDLKDLPGMHKKIIDAYHILDRCMYDHNVSDGSTATVALLTIKSKQLHLINTGDSRTVVWDGDNIIATKDHKPLEEAERILKGGGYVTTWGIPRVNGVLGVSRAFGDYILKKRNGIYVDDGAVIVTPNMTTINLTNKAYTMVLASDGLWDVMNDNIVVNLPAESCEQLITKALKLGNTDNITVMQIIIIPDGEKIPSIIPESEKIPSIIPETEVLDHVITINAHGNWLSDQFKLPSGINLLVPHHKGLGHKYITEHCPGVSYEQQLYNYGYFNYTSGWTLYKSGDMVQNMLYSPLKKNCHHLINKDYLFDIMIPCVTDQIKRGWCPIFVSAGGKPLLYKNTPRIKIKACDKYTLKELCDGLPAALEELKSNGIINTVKYPIILIPFTCNAEKDTKDRSKLAKQGLIPINISGQIEKVAWNTPLGEIYDLLA